MNKCPKCGELENFHYNYDYSKAERPVLDILCNECGEFFHPSLDIPKVKKDIPTAEEILFELLSDLKEDNMVDYLKDNPEEADDYSEKIIRFAKLHVEAALKAAAENAVTKYINPRINEDIDIDKDSILNAYSLTNIK